MLKFFKIFRRFEPTDFEGEFLEFRKLYSLSNFNISFFNLSYSK